MATVGESWSILPKAGLGALRFGAKSSDIDKLKSVYGAIVNRRADRIPDAILQETLAQFGGALSEKEKQEMLQMYAQHGPSASSVSEVRGKAGLSLTYEAEGLVAIMLNRRHQRATLAGERVFALSARDVLVSAERLNNAPGRYRATQAAFDNIALSLDGFSVAEQGRSVEIMPGSNERFVERTIELRAEPYVPRDELREFVVRSFT